MFARPFSPKLSSSKDKISLKSIKNFCQFNGRKEKIQQENKEVVQISNQKRFVQRLCKTTFSNEKNRTKNCQESREREKRQDSLKKSSVNNKRIVSNYSADSKIKFLQNGLKCQSKNQKNKQFNFISFKSSPNIKGYMQPLKKCSLSSSQKKLNKSKDFVDTLNTSPKLKPITFSKQASSKKSNIYAKNKVNTATQFNKNCKKLVKKNIRQCYQELKIKYNELKLEYDGTKSLCKLNSPQKSQHSILLSENGNNTNQSSNPESKNTINDENNQINQVKFWQNQAICNSIQQNLSDLVNKPNSQTSIRIQTFQTIKNSALYSPSMQKQSPMNQRKNQKSLNQFSPQNSHSQQYYKTYSHQLQKQLQFACKTVVELKNEIEKINNHKTNNQFIKVQDQKNEISKFCQNQGSKTQKNELYQNKKIEQQVNVQNQIKTQQSIEYREQKQLAIKPISKSYLESQNSPYKLLSPEKVYSNSIYNTDFKDQIVESQCDEIEQRKKSNLIYTGSNYMSSFNENSSGNQIKQNEHKVVYYSAVQIIPERKQNIKEVNHNVLNPNTVVNNYARYENMNVIKAQPRIISSNQSTLQANSPILSISSPQASKIVSVSSVIQKYPSIKVISPSNQTFTSNYSSYSSNSYSNNYTPTVITINSSNTKTKGYYSYCRKNCQLNQCKCLFDMINISAGVAGYKNQNKN